MLLRVPIYVTKCCFFKEDPGNHKICQIAARRSVPVMGRRYSFLATRHLSSSSHATCLSIRWGMMANVNASFLRSLDLYFGCLDLY